MNLKNALVLAIILLNSFFVINAIKAEEKTEFKDFSVFILPETNSEGTIITKLRLIIENTSDKPYWIREKDMDAEKIDIYTQMDDGSGIGSGGVSRKTYGKDGDPLQDVFIKVLPKSMFGVTLVLKKERYIEWAKYLDNKISISISIEIKRSAEEKDPKSGTRFEAILIKTPFTLEPSKSTEATETKK